MNQEIKFIKSTRGRTQCKIFAQKISLKPALLKRRVAQNWLLKLTSTDITLDLAHNFVEISLPVSQQTACVPLVSQNVPERFLRWKRTYATPCILALTGLLIRLFICTVMLYALYSVYRQYTLISDGTNSRTKIKVFPGEENDNGSKA